MGIYGNLGGGKSFNANLIVVLHVLFGSSALIFDPKSERSHWAAKLDFMGDLISIVRLTPNDEDKGKLDPFNLYNDNICLLYTSAGDKTLEYDTYIFISLLKGDDKDFISKGGEMFEYMIKSPKKALNEFLGISQKTISERDFRIYKKKSTEFLEIQ